MAVDGDGPYKQQFPGSPGSFPQLKRNEDAMDEPRTGQFQSRRWNLITVTHPWLVMLICLLAFITTPANAAFINFDNCLEPSILNDPTQLQFVPYFFSVVYDTSPGPNPLNITVYGNVTGAAQGQTAPAPGSSQWANSSDTAGKIVNITDDDGTETYTTLFTTIDVLSFTPYDQPTEFCPTVIQGTCPLGPVFNVNGYEFDIFSFSLATFYFSLS